MAYLTRGPKRFKAWRERNQKTVAEVARAMGPAGEQLHKWSNGNRPALPLHVLAVLAEVTGEPPSTFATLEQRRLVERLQRLEESPKEQDDPAGQPAAG